MAWAFTSWDQISEILHAMKDFKYLINLIVFGSRAGGRLSFIYKYKRQGPEIEREGGRRSRFDLMLNP